MWHAFNLIREGDRVTGTTFRKVAKESGMGADSERIKLKLTIDGGPPRMYARMYVRGGGGPLHGGGGATWGGVGPRLLRAVGVGFGT